MTKPVNVVLADRLYLPDVPVVRERADALFKVGMYKEIACKRCSFVSDRPCDQCEGCPNNEGTLTLWKKAVIDDRPKIGIPIGDRALLKRMVGKTKLMIQDRRVKPPMRFPLRMTKKLYDYQVKACRDMVEKGYGILQSPARSGKTMMAVAISVKLKLRTLIVAAQEDWLDQFLIEYRKSTNLTEIEEFEGRPIAKICNRPEQMVGIDIVLCTYQTYLETYGKERLEAVKRKFGLVICDEVHDGAALGYAKVLAAFHARYRFGLSATPRRKDGRMHIVFKIIGPVATIVKIPQMTPRVILVETPAKPKTKYKSWQGAMNFLFKHEKRNAMIVAYAVHYIKQGRSVMIPTTSVSQAKLLTDAINVKLGETLAAMFAGKMLRNKPLRTELLEKLRSGDLKCVVGSRKVVQVGLNIPILSVLFVQAPISNEPKFEQETRRVCTKIDDKPEPLIVHFIDKNLKQAISAFTTCYQQTYKPNNFLMSEETKRKAKAYIASGKFALSSAIRFGDPSGGIV